MAFSIAVSAWAAHSKKLDDAARTHLHRSINVHQMAAIGFLVLGSYYADSTWQTGLFGILGIASFLFPGVIYYNHWFGRKAAISRFIPMGGMLHMAFWVALGFSPRH